MISQLFGGFSLVFSETEKCFMLISPSCLMTGPVMQTQDFSTMQTANAAE